MMKKMTVLWMAALILLVCGICAGCAEEAPEPTGETEQSAPVSDTLAAPVIRLEGNVVSWEPVEHADYYPVFVNGVWQKVVRGQTQYVMEQQVNGEYTVQVYACDSYKNFKSSPYSNAVAFVVDRQVLAAPQLTLQEETLTWSSVEGATEYRLYVNGIVKKDWLIRAVDGVYTCPVSFDQGGTYEICVKAISDDAAYEGESASNAVVYKFSTDKRWYAAQIHDQWELYGDARLDMQWIQLSSAGQATGLKHRLLVDREHPFLHLEFEKIQGVAEALSPEQVVVTVNGSQLPALAGDALSNIPDNVFVYDLSGYIDTIADVTLELRDGTTLVLRQIRLFSRNNVSLMTTWDPEAIAQEWAAQGKTVEHVEGFCLECENGNSAAITNMVHIGGQTVLEISFRKFLRIGGEDQDPKVYVYVNGEAVAPIGGGEYASVSTEAYTPFRYDLSGFAGQDVQIRIESAEGEHACFSALRLTN